MFLNPILFTEKISDLTTDLYLRHLNQIVRWWNDHDSGARVWTRMIAGGTRTNDSASAGQIGEYVSSYASAVAAGATMVWSNITSISLTAGDWDVSGIAHGVHTTLATIASVAISVNSGNTTTDQVIGDNQANFNMSDGDETQSIPVYRLSLSTTTTVYLKGYQTYAAPAGTWSGRISARRIR